MLHVLISGSVQGVGYRYFVKSKARELGLRGFVKNLPDGRVEAVFAGKKEKLNMMIKFLKKGPFLAEVDNLEINWNSKLEIDNMEFRIIK
jgi:acylphosphatase